MREIRASVVIATAGRGVHLGQQLRALAQQRGSVSFEVIVVANDSLAADALEEHRQRAHGLRTRFIEALGRRGAGYARNAGVLASEGRVLLFCDDDDQVGPTWVDAMVHGLRDREFATGPLDLAELNEPWIVASRGRAWAERQLTYHGVFPFGMGCNIGARREEFVSLGGFAEDVFPVDDIELGYRAWEAGLVWGFEEAALVRYRLRSDLKSMMKQAFGYGRGDEMILDRLRRDSVARPSERRQRLRRWLWIVRNVYRLASREGRYRWCWTSATEAGRLFGRLAPRVQSLPVRTLFTGSAACAKSC